MTFQDANNNDSVKHEGIEPNGKPKGLYYDDRIIWYKVFRIFLLHALGIYGLIFYMPYMKWQTLTFGFFYLMATGLGVSCGAHRLWAHRSYKAKLPLRILLMLLNSATMQNDLYIWVRDHRVHHKYTETDADPHNIKRGFFFAHCGWLMMKKHPEVTLKGSKIDCSDVLADPVVQFQRKYYMPLVILTTAVFPISLAVFGWGESLTAAFFCTFTRMTYSLNSTWLVNSWAHLWGTRPFDKHIQATETNMVSVMALGEGYHNFHHVFPFDYRSSELGWKNNISKTIIEMFAKIGWAYDLRTVSEDMILKKKLASGDGTRLPPHAA